MKWVWAFVLAGYAAVAAEGTNEVAQLREQLQRQTAISRQLEEKLVQVTRALADAQIRLQEQSRLIAAGSSVKKPSALSEAEPAWAVSPVLLSPAKTPLGTNLVFQSLFGRKVTFRDPNGPPRTFDVEDLHPDALAYLRIDPETAKTRHAEIAEQKKRALAGYYSAATAARDAWRNYNSALVRAEQDRAAAEQQRQQAELQESMRILAEQNEQLRANAALQAANQILPVDEEGVPILPE